MRAVTIGIVAMLCCGCAAPAFDLVARAPEAQWLSSQNLVRTESSRATVSASYACAWLDHLIFEVEIVNQSGSTLDVDPEDFSYRLAGRDHKVRLGRSVAAASPTTVVSLLDMSVPYESYEPIVVTEVGRPQPPPPCVAPELPPPDTVPDWILELQRARERSIQHLLRHLALAPGESVRGELWLPARPVGRAMGSEPSGRVSSFHDITLRTPDALGGQEIEYSVVPER